MVQSKFGDMEVQVIRKNGLREILDRLWEELEVVTQMMTVIMSSLLELVEMKEKAVKKMLKSEFTTA